MLSMLNCSKRILLSSTALFTLGALAPLYAADSADLAPAEKSAKSAATSNVAGQDEAGEKLPIDQGDSSLSRQGQKLTPAQIALGEKIRKVLATYEAKHLNARDHTNWEVMHSLIAFGPRTQIYRDGPGGTKVNAIGWLLWGGRCQSQSLIVLSNGQPHAQYGVGLQGHDGQFLAMLAQWRVRPQSPMRIGGKDMTVADFIEEEKVTCRSGTELTFKLIALSHYLPSDAKWKSRNGESWDIPKLIREEIKSPISGAACGGTHRLFGISNAYKVRLKRDEPLDGEYLRAHKYITDYQRYTFTKLQNRDGSFSTEWFNRPADRIGDLDRKLQTTGHILEWLAWSLPDEQLSDPRMMRAADFLAGLLQDNSQRSWSIGPLGHGLHALMIYHERLYTQPALPAVQVAASEPLRTAARPVANSNDPPEPSCEHCNDSLPIDKLRHALKKAKAEASDGCVDAVPGTTDKADANTAALELPRPALQ